MKKRLIIMFVFAFIFILFQIFLMISNNKSYVVFSDKSIIKVSGKKYKFVDFKDSYLVNKKFDVYDYNKYIGKYNVKFFEDRYKVYNKKDVASFKNSFVGIYSNDNQVKLNTASVDELNLLDINFLYKILSDNNISFNGQLTINEKRAINSNNGYYLYNVSYNDMYSDNEKLFSIVYISNLKNYSIIKSSFVNNSEFNKLVSYNIDSVIDLDGDSIDEVIISDLMFSQSGTGSKEIYSFIDGKYVLSY